MSSITRLRRIPVPVADPDDNVILAGALLRCARCSATWTARLMPFGDEVDPADVRCAQCDAPPPEAA